METPSFSQVCFQGSGMCYSAEAALSKWQKEHTLISLTNKRNFHPKEYDAVFMLTKNPPTHCWASGLLLRNTRAGLATWAAQHAQTEPALLLVEGALPLLPSPPLGPGLGFSAKGFPKASSLSSSCHLSLTSSHLYTKSELLKGTYSLIYFIS